MARLHPGIVLLEERLRPKNLSQNQIARAIKVPPRRINEIVLGKRAITADTALRLGRYFGNSPSYWMHLQVEYDLEQAHKKIGMNFNTIQALYMDADRLNTSTSSTENNDNNSAAQKNIKRRMMR
jgi:addiction module HigA family antidote